MRSSYTQLLLANVVLAVLIVTVLFGAPVVPSIAGALGAGLVLYAGYRRDRRRRSEDAVHHHGKLNFRHR